MPIPSNVCPKLRISPKYKILSDLQGLCANNLNNDFEHQCFDDAMWQLGTRELQPASGDIGEHVLEIPGIPKARYLPHQVWGVGFVLQRFMQVDNLGLTGVLIADDMGLGKTYTALGAVLHIKWLIKCAKQDKPIPFYGQKLTELPTKCPLLVEDSHIIRRPILIMVPPALVPM